GTAGRIRYLSWVRNDEPGGALADTGSTLRPRANTTMRTTPETNSGTVESERLVVESTRSTIRPRFSAAMIPPRMLTGTTITKAKAASLSERPMYGKMNELTG